MLLTTEPQNFFVVLYCYLSGWAFIQLLLEFFFAQFYILIKSEHFCPFKRTALKIQDRSLEFTRNQLIALAACLEWEKLVGRVQAVGPGFGHTRLYRFGVEPRICISKFTYDADDPGLKTD